MNLASRYISSPDNMDQSEVDSFTSLLISSLESKDVKTDNGMLKNILIMIVNKVNDIPVWFYHDNPNVKTITLQKKKGRILLRDLILQHFLQVIFMLKTMPILWINQMNLKKYKINL